MKRPDLSRLAPPGFGLRTELQLFGTGSALAVLNSARYPVRFIRARRDVILALQRGLTPEMPDFCSLIDGVLLGFALLAACMLLAAAAHYLYHLQGSKSIYLMRRLPSRWELHRRCLTLPVLGAALCLVASAVLLLLYLGIYRLFTPEILQTPLQWQKLWSVLL